MTCPTAGLQIPKCNVPQQPVANASQYQPTAADATKTGSTQGTQTADAVQGLKPQDQLALKVGQHVLSQFAPVSNDAYGARATGKGSCPQCGTNPFASDFRQDKIAA